MTQPIGPEDRSTLQFERVWVREANFVDIEGDQTPIQPGQHSDFGIRLEVRITNAADAGQRAYVLLRAIIEPPSDRPMFARLSAAVEGSYTVSDGDAKRLAEFSKLQAPVLLLPYLRALVTSITALSRIGPVILPPLNMVSLIAQMNAAVEQGEAAKHSG